MREIHGTAGIVLPSGKSVDGSLSELARVFVKSWIIH